MNLFKQSFHLLKPVIYICWIIAAFRLVLESQTTDLNVVAMMSVYSTLLVLFLHSAFTGGLDALAGKKLFAGALVLGVTCFFLPNTISYTTAQFAGWSHGRYYYDPEFWAVQKPFMDEGKGYFESSDLAEAKLGRSSQGRGPGPADTASAKVMAGLTIGFFTTIAGTLASLVLGLLLIWLPASLRRRATA